jgi:hypothetical protein
MAPLHMPGRSCGTNQARLRRHSDATSHINSLETEEWAALK